MALQVNIPEAEQHDAGITQVGVDLPAAYIKVVSLIWHYQPERGSNNEALNGEITFTACLWASKSARDNNANYIGERRYVLHSPDLSSDLLQQCYLAMKEDGSFYDVDLTSAVDV